MTLARTQAARSKFPGLAALTLTLTPPPKGEWGCERFERERELHCPGPPPLHYLTGKPK